MPAPLALELGTPAAAQVQQAVHDVLVRHELATSDDAVMAEYVTVMMANRKGPEAVAAELGELVGGALDSSLINEFWQKAEAIVAPSKPRERSASPPRRVEARHEQRQRENRWKSSEQHEPKPQRSPRRREEPPSEVRGRGRKGGMASDAPQLSIFGRAGVPDPHAPAFEPKTIRKAEPAAQQSSLMDRLEPGAEAAPRDIALFPTHPANSVLCHFATHCTNPMCQYSHPSPANAGKDGDEMALVLREDACENGSDCADKDCVLSHVSPAVAFVKKRGVVPPPAIGGVPCRFQEACINPACPYIHTDAFGRVVPPPASQSASTRCRYGASCTRPDCRFSHPNAQKVPCRYGDNCTRSDCIFSHERRRPVAADRLAAFAVEDGERELVLPGGGNEANANAGANANAHANGGGGGGGDAVTSVH
ncbi:mRNA-binding protein nab2 [Malassezia cuniculi]|uniref:mRNA-binding protein nab2 n=1 Tax=Malassezia cuniculi TaxID=948313 RepID=A0AAF0ETN4_9BASI|nr:mRNA-binding protein nab2 [Malassezia cuniculi]